MQNERRTSERLDLYWVVQFKPVKTPVAYSLGVLRNLSSNGLSFESQVVDIEEGETLELVLKNPENNMVLSCKGIILWKKKSDKFNTFAGIRFLNLDATDTYTIMEMLSYREGMLSVSFFQHEHAEHSENEQKETDTGKEAPKPDPEHSTDELVYDGETENSHEFTSESHDAPIDFSKIDISNSDPISEKDGHGTKIGYFITVILVILTAVAITVFVFKSKAKKDVGAPSITSTYPAAPPASPEDHTLPVETTAQNITTGYTVQVGAWKKYEYAQATLLKLQKDYEGAYLMRKNEFYIIRISGITTQQQVTTIVKDIEAGMGLKPILVKPDQ